MLNTRTTLWTVVSGRSGSFEAAVTAGAASVSSARMVLTLRELMERAAYARRNAGAILGLS